MSFFLVARMCLACLLVSGGDDVGERKANVAKRAVPEDQAQFFEERIRPVLAGRCFKCHGPLRQESGLRLDSRESLLRGTDESPVVVPGRPEESLLIEAIGHDRRIKMPPDSKLEPQAIADLARWVQMGAPWPDRPRRPGEGLFQEGARSVARRHWAFEPITDPTPPEVKAKAWLRTSVDRFILAGLERRGLWPSPQADRRTLIRRASFDLTGLPPTPEEVDAFEVDSAL